ncbi:L-serine ammonia-lyase [Sansalvadorimonas sp. 2012CJ34-2]|uniref:L-serine dehydratase n=1 Tax=Parendozoicomonas callyspongiae TaxID=2942213 RepID=A0ABT0PEW4_9GAMM|nr:L-serine ammonia-lyase [Sansalvadorimonas sp. 2012CJ34-2]MCL6269860.1 L-serine ammonia-lyase [Sansalvadorimonas sp. 2012CJ34-2]
MSISVFDLFKIGLGPSSSHTVGPMSAAFHFASQLAGQPVAVVQITLYGSLSLTGKGHATDRAVVYGLSGLKPETTLPDEAGIIWSSVKSSGQLSLPCKKEIPFDPDRNILFVDQPLPEHPNGMKFTATAEDGSMILEQIWFSTGGGFIATREDLTNQSGQQNELTIPYPFSSAEELLRLCASHQINMAELLLANEKARGSDEKEISNSLDNILQTMESCIERGFQTEGVLPGGLDVQRRAPGLYQRWQKEVESNDPLQVMDWVSLCALAVNEENAAGGRVVTSPTNGAAGVIPAVIAFHKQYDRSASQDSVRLFLLTAAAIGMLYKKNASISAAEVGCQGEIGVASSMAAAGLVAAWGGTMEQVEHAAEIAMEHHLGMTCDPVAGLVQVPCIERNAMGAVKAINAARMALSGDGKHRVTLDQVIETMYQTGKDMQDRYKETSQGGLAVNVVYC